MSECPSYYRVADGREFWEWYAERCTPIARNRLTYDQSHALASACEYIFRCGRKTPNPLDDMRKASSLIGRIYRAKEPFDSNDGLEKHISHVIGLVVQEKIAVEIAEKPKTVDLTDPYRACWTGVETHKP